MDGMGIGSSEHCMEAAKVARGQHVSIAYEIVTDGRRWLGHPHLDGCWGGIALGAGLPAAGQDHIYVTVSHAGVHVCVYVLFSETPGIVKRNERMSGAN